MHMTKPTSRLRLGETYPARGFTLVELMIALAVSLIVALAAIGFVVSLIKANSENLKVTRLTQELRSLSEVMGREIRRARNVSDPVGLIGSIGANNRDLIDTDTPGCIFFSFDEPPDPGVTVSRSIRLDGTEIILDPTGTSCASSPDEVRISTSEVEILDLDFVPDDPLHPSTIDIVVEGKLANSPPDLASVRRTFRQTVYVRSGEVN